MQKNLSPAPPERTRSASTGLGGEAKDPGAEERRRYGAERLAREDRARREAKQAEQAALSERIRASREDTGDTRRAASRAARIAEIEAFKTLFAHANAQACMEARKRAPAAGMHGFKQVCALLRQRASEEAGWLDEPVRKQIGFFHFMVKNHEVWCTKADELRSHEEHGITRELTALGPFVGLRISIHSLLIGRGIVSINALRAAVDDGSINLERDITSTGFTARRWSEMMEWLETRGTSAQVSP